MDNYLITVIILCFYLKSVLTEPDLQKQNAAQDDINPLNDFGTGDASVKDQDKRTIFNKDNYGWAKHVSIKPTGQKIVLGYSPVDLKYTPVIRPLKHQGYVYSKPAIHFHVKKPVLLRPAQSVHPSLWKPVVPIKPVVPVVNTPALHHHVLTKPASTVHTDHVHVKPVHHVDHVHQVQVPHADHVHNVPVHVDHVHPAPIHPVHVDHVHPVAVQPVALPQPVVLPQQWAVPAPQPFVPVHPSPQFVHSPLFEVTKPNLGVLPLGATFPSPILRQLPPAAPAVPFHLKPALLPQPVLPAAVPVPQPFPLPRPAVIGQPVAPQPAYPPGTVVEYHGTTNFVNQIPLHQVPSNAVQPALPSHVHLHYPQIHQHVPSQPAHFLPHEQHDVQTPVIPANHPHFIQQPLNPSHFQQPLPQEAPSHFRPTDHVNNPTIFQQLPGNIQQTQFQAEQQLPQDAGPRYQPADQVSNQQFFHGSVNPHQSNFEQLDNSEGGYVYQQPDTPFGQQTVQPGETDLQLPVHLPQHPGFVQDSGTQLQQQESVQFHGAFRPSVQLEPPYKK